MSAINIKDFELVKGRKFSTKSIWNIGAIKRLRAKRHFKIEEYEEVFDPIEVLLTVIEMDLEVNNKRKQNDE